MDEHKKEQRAQRRLNALDQQTGAEPEGEKEERWIDCPNCGTEAHRKKCSYSLRGWNCFICGEHGGLADLMERLHTPKSTVPFVAQPVTRKTQKRQGKPFYWQQHAAEILNAFESVQSVVPLWQDYCPLTETTIRAHHLGIGVLPVCRCKHRRLIYPAFNARGQIVAFRGRAFECDCVKWIQSAGSKITLWGAGLLSLYDRLTVIVPESPVDAMLAMQMSPTIRAVASTGGAANWKKKWSQYLARLDIQRLIVWYDNDLAGMPCQARLKELEREWRAKHPKAQRLPRPNAPKVANSIIDAGTPALLYRWPVTAPLKADLSWALMKGFVR